MRRFLACWIGVVACCVSSFGKAAGPGLINMPDASFNPDGTLQFGLSNARPYFGLSANATLLPGLGTKLGVPRITGVPGFSTGGEGFGQGYGAYKEKTSGLEVRLVAEDPRWASGGIGVEETS